MSAIARMLRRGAAGTNRGLSEPPFIADLIGAWHFSQGVEVLGGEVQSWTSFLSRNDPTGYVLDDTFSSNPIGNLTPNGVAFTSASLLLSTVGAWTDGHAVAVRYERDATQHSSLTQAFIARVRAPVADHGYSVIGYESSIATPIAILAGPGGTPISYMQSSETPDTRKASVGYSINDGGAALHRMRVDPDDADISGNSGSGAVSSMPGTSSASFALGDNASPFIGTIRAAIMYSRGLSEAELDEVIAYLESLP